MINVSSLKSLREIKSSSAPINKIKKDYLSLFQLKTINQRQCEILGFNGELNISKRSINMILSLKKFSRSKLVKIKIMITKAAIKLDIQKCIIGNSNKELNFLIITCQILKN
ncbi:hypothetical protein BpHYR1_013986 [Brachionus plicatilis]|uniref:Uncharacterized protein n=1 Tax=Brachionus plicatilis TaxID=10195 RepID=A0A3M7SS95_BRAPC|nr:hypothetical protein BpHYR1_013986 [Brachionus plicatilis]